MLGFLKKSSSKKVFSLNKPRNYAILSKATYMNDIDRINYLKEKLPDYHIDPQLSNDRILVATNPNTKEVVSAFRGTKTQQDWGTNLLVGLGLERLGSRYKNGFKNSQEVEKKYSDYNHTLTGHSLGSKLSYDIANKLNKNSYNFDMPSSIGNLTNGMAKLSLPFTGGLAPLRRRNMGNKKANLYSTPMDPIGMAGIIGESGNKFLVKPKKGVHSINNYI